MRQRKEAVDMSNGELWGEKEWNDHIKSECEESGCGISTKEAVWMREVEAEMAKRGLK